MGHIKGITNLGIVKNPQYLEPWFIAIGRFIINFGGLEMLTYKLLDNLEESEEELLKNTDKLFMARIKRISNLLLKRDIQVNEEIFELLENIKELAKWRNRLAHNPVLPTWKPESNSETSPPDLLGIPDMKLINKENKISNSISLNDLNKLNEYTVEYAELLHDFSNEI